jgi:hypothetical protein
MPLSFKTFISQWREDFLLKVKPENIWEHSGHSQPIIMVFPIDPFTAVKTIHLDESLQLELIREAINK